MRKLPPDNVSDLIGKLGGSVTVARAIGRSVGTVASWRHRNALPVEIWPSFIALASENENTPSVDAEWMLAHHAPEPAGADA